MPRDPLKMARNKQVELMKTQLRELLPRVLRETRLRDEASLNATIGHKADHCIDLKNEVIVSPDHYVALWTEGFKERLQFERFETSFAELFALIKSSNALKQYLNLFLRRSYLKHYEELCKTRPHVHEAEVWIGHNHADYGLLVAPRFANGDWENDKSEIRHFKPIYWTIGHVLTTGLVVPRDPDIMSFHSVDGYLKFFEHVLVRGTASPYQKQIAARYSGYVRASDCPESIPLLIPEFRYEGRETSHKYRLDFVIIDGSTMDKVGFELSPWSTHGELRGIKGKTQKEINAVASANFDKEMKKHKDFFKKHDIYSLIYTDADLADMEGVFQEVARHLVPREPARQLSFQYLEDFFGEGTK